MKMIGKFATTIVAVGAFSAIIFTSTSADSMKPAQSAAFLAAADASQSRVEPFSYPYDFTLRAEPFSYPYDFTQWVEPARSSGPLNSKETPQEQQNDRQYN
jgi:hypothetical protein